MSPLATGQGEVATGSGTRLLIVDDISTMGGVDFDLVHFPTATGALDLAMTAVQYFLVRE